MEAINKIKGNQYSLRIVGLWGKNRKVKDDFVDLIKFTESTHSEEELTAFALAKVRGIGGKVGLRWYVYQYDAENDGILTSVIVKLGSQNVQAHGTVES